MVPRCTRLGDWRSRPCLQRFLLEVPQQSAHHICRHGFYHVVILSDYDGNTVKRRRRGKPLRSCIAIVRETAYGMAGRILTFQDHPFECLTNYAAMVCMRCNVDVQDLRRTLPPKLWLPDSELEPEEDSEHCEEVCRHGQYPQRLQSFSHAPQEEWGWMSHLGCAPHPLEQHMEMQRFW